MAVDMHACCECDLRLGGLRGGCGAAAVQIQRLAQLILKVIHTRESLTEEEGRIIVKDRQERKSERSGS